MLNYYENMYNKLRQQPLMIQKYEHAGIYCIKINDVVVYIGKSKNMLYRVAQHYVGIKQLTEHKYRLLAEAQRRGYAIEFDVIYNAKSKQKKDIDEEIGKAECFFIRKYKPLLNAQIPHEDNYKKYTLNRKATEMSADEFIKAISK